MKKKTLQKHSTSGWDESQLISKVDGKLVSMFTDSSCHFNPKRVKGEQALLIEEDVSYLFSADAGNEWRQVSGKMWATNYRLFLQFIKQQQIMNIFMMIW